MAVLSYQMVTNTRMYTFKSLYQVDTYFCRRQVKEELMLLELSLRRNNIYCKSSLSPQSRLSPRTQISPRKALNFEISPPFE